MKSRSLWAAFAVGAVVGGVIFLPAGLFAVALEQVTNGRLSLADSAGTVWKGRGQLVWQMRPGRGLGLGEITWRVTSSRLFVGELAVELQQSLGGQPGHAKLAVSPGSRRLREADLGLPATLLSELSPVWATLTPEGWLRLRSRDFAFRTGEFVGEAEVNWTLARFFGGIEAGSYQLALRGEADARLAGTLGTQAGDIVASGQGTWQAKTGLQMRARLALRPGAENGRALPLFRALCAGVRQECEFNIQ